MIKNQFSLTMEDLKKISLTYDPTKLSISHMNTWQKYKNKYSRILFLRKNF